MSRTIRVGNRKSLLSLVVLIFFFSDYHLHALPMLKHGRIMSIQVVGLQVILSIGEIMIITLIMARMIGLLTLQLNG
jgi:hypothetical protein